MLRPIRVFALLAACVAAFLVLPVTAVADDSDGGQVSGEVPAWMEPLAELMATTDAGAHDELIDRVLEAEPSWSDVAGAIRSMPFPDPQTSGDAELRTTVCTDGVERPWVLVPPSSYDPARPTPLLVVLHGGVSRATIIDDPLEYAVESHFVGLARDRGWFALLPFGQIDATWWDEVGYENIESLIRTVKREYNIDDDRVYMSGFSDGSSAGFFFAMTMPTDYAAIAALNGHIGVGSLDGDQPTYAQNMAAVPVYATTTFNDGLYPSWKMRSTIEMAQDAGGDILYRELAGEHDLTPFADTEMPLIGDFLDRHPRDPFPPFLQWEATGELFGRCRWVSIDAFAPGVPAEWHLDYNVPLIDDRITFGFHPDWDGSEEGNGIPVDGLSDGDYPATRMGLLAGDTIVGAATPATDDERATSMDIGTLDDLNEFKETLERGDAFSLDVLREGVEVTLDGALDPVGYYNIFKREVPTAAIRASVSGNRIRVEPSALGAFSVYIYPQLLNLDERVTVTSGESVLFDAVVEPDLEYTLRDYVERRDRSMLCAAKLSFDLLDMGE